MENILIILALIVAIIFIPYHVGKYLLRGTEHNDLPINHFLTWLFGIAILHIIISVIFILFIS